MTREFVFRLYLKLLFILSGVVLMTGGCDDDLSRYLTLVEQRLLGAGIFLLFSWWTYRWLKWHIQHNLDYVRVYDAPIHFHEPLGQKYKLDL